MATPMLIFEHYNHLIEANHYSHYSLEVVAHSSVRLSAMRT